MSSTNTLKQIGLLIGLTASVAIGAAVVLWLWIPDGNEKFGVNKFGLSDSFANQQIMRDGSRELSYQAGFRDKNTNLIAAGNSRGNNENLVTHSGIQLEYTQNLEASYTRRIERLLEPLLGADSIRAQVTADIDFTAREQTLETYDPDSVIVRSKELEENIKNSGGAEKTVATNKLRKETNSYELDKTIRFTRSAIGRIDKLHIAVLVDDKITRGVKGNKIRTPRTEEELVKFTDLVKKSVGFNAKRGDVVNVISASFKTRRAKNVISASPTWGQVWVKDLFNKTLGTALVLLLIFSVIRPTMKSLVSLPTNYSGGRGQFDPATGGYVENSNDGTSEINNSGNYEKNMVTAATVVQRDPKLVAQIMKNWVSADGA